MAAAILMLALTAGCSGGELWRQYEYEEEMYLSLDGSATVYVHASLAALNALRGSPFDVSPTGPVDRDAVRRFFTSPVSTVSAPVTTSRRSNRRFVHVRVDVDDVRQLSASPPFAWSSYRFTAADEVLTFQQTAGAAAGGDAGRVTWEGDELVAFRLHLPSKIVFHNAGEGNLKRGNILVWEQPLADRLRGVPVEIEARMETQSILYRTLWLFAGTVVAVALMFVAVIWLIVRRGGRRAPQRTS